MPWIEKRENGSYRLVVDMGRDTNGKRIRHNKVVNTASKRIAERQLALFVAELESTGFQKKDKVTMEQLADKWVKLFVLVELEYKTQENYLYQLADCKMKCNRKEKKKPVKDLCKKGVD